MLVLAGRKFEFFQNCSVDSPFVPELSRIDFLLALVSVCLLKYIFALACFIQYLSLGKCCGCHRSGQCIFNAGKGGIKSKSMAMVRFDGTRAMF